MATAQQQKFRVTPHDLQVLEGSEALLQCEVSNLAGQVQWTKDGFALGKFKTISSTFFVSPKIGISTFLRLIQPLSLNDETLFLAISFLHFRCDWLIYYFCCVLMVVDEDVIVGNVKL